MLKKYRILALLVFIGSVANAQKAWMEKSLDEKVKVTFPAEVKQVNENTYMSKDSLGTVFAVVMINIDKNSYHEASATDSLLTRIKFLDQVVNDIKAKMPKYAIGDVKISQINAVKTYCLTGLNAENNSNVFINIFLVGDTSYSLTCFVGPGTDPQHKDYFLKNFSVSK